MEEAHLQAILKDLGHNEFQNSKEITRIKNVIIQQEEAIRALQLDNKRLHDVIFKQIFPIINEANLSDLDE